MTEIRSGVFSLKQAYVHLSDAAEATKIDIGPEFWSDGVTNLAPGRLVSAFFMTENWDVWEQHPAGDEIVICLSGALEMICEGATSEWRHSLEAGSAVIVPQGIWHTADILQPCNVMFITRGDGTAHKPRSGV